MDRKQYNKLPDKVIFDTYKKWIKDNYFIRFTNWEIKVLNKQIIIN